MSTGLTSNGRGRDEGAVPEHGAMAVGGEAIRPCAFRLAKSATPAGGGGDGHRSGWPYVVARMHERQSPEGILVDDFVESTFKPIRGLPVWKRLLGKSGPPRHVWESPWIGFFHLPPNFPEWFNPDSHPDVIFSELRFRQSLPHMKGAVVFSEYAGDWIRKKFGVPVLVAKHPTEMVPRTFDWDLFKANPDKQIVQIGWYLRNYRAIYQVSVPSPFRKVHIAQSRPFIQEARRLTDLHSPFRDRPDTGDTEVVSWLKNDAYDALLTRNVMFLELFDASANNAVTEAIARDTPVVVNRHPAVAEYLGADYPLFYDSLDEVAGLLEMPRIRAAHEHIRALDKAEFTVDAFIDHLDRFVRDIR